MSLKRILEWKNIYQKRVSHFCCCWKVGCMKRRMQILLKQDNLIQVVRRTITEFPGNITYCWNQFLGPKWSCSCQGCHISKPKLRQPPLDNFLYKGFILPVSTHSLSIWPNSFGIGLFLLELCWYLTCRLFRNFSFALGKNPEKWDPSNLHVGVPPHSPFRDSGQYYI